MVSMHEENQRRSPKVDFGLTKSFPTSIEVIILAQELVRSLMPLFSLFYYYHSFTGLLSVRLDLRVFMPLEDVNVKALISRKRCLPNYLD